MLKYISLLSQVIPASVRSVPPDGTAQQPLERTSPNSTQLSEAPNGQQPVVQNGHIIHWPGFEALMHYALYQQARDNHLVAFSMCCQSVAAHQGCVSQQLGWQIGEEGNVIMPEPLFTSRVSFVLHMPLKRLFSGYSVNAGRKGTAHTIGIRGVQHDWLLPM